MNRLLSIFLLVSLAFMVTGCKLEHNSRVKQTQLLGEIQTIEATTRVEVSGCTDYKDKTKESDSLAKTNNIIKKIFPDSEFEGCKNENMKSMATYITTMMVGTLSPDVKGFEPEGVTIIRNQSGIVFFCLSKQIQKEITDGRKDAMTNDISLHVNIRFTNDTKEEIKIFPYAVFVDGSPFAGLPDWKNTVVIKPKNSVLITLSDVASEYAIANGVVPIFVEPVEQ